MATTGSDERSRLISAIVTRPAASSPCAHSRIAFSLARRQRSEQKRWGRPPVARWANGPEHEWAQGELAADRVAIAEIKRERASDWALP